MEFEVKLQGFKELAEGLRKLGDAVGKNVLRKAVAAGAAEIKNDAKKNALAIKRTGVLARSIYQKQIPEQSNNEKQVFYVGARQGKSKRKKNADAYYARFVEYGHFSRPSHGGRLPRLSNRGQRDNELLETFVRAGHVKWVPAKPFMRPAFDVKKEAAVQKMGEFIGLSLLPEAEKLGMRVGK